MFPLNLFRIDCIAFTVLGYPLSYLELVGTLFYLASVWLIAKRHIWTWPVGIVSVLLYGMLFYQIQLYSDTLEQIYYLAASIYGWWNWKKTEQCRGIIQDVRYSSIPKMFYLFVCTVFISGLAGALMSRIHLLSPSLFPEPASFPFMDALTTIMSFTAMWLMAQKRIESWIYWIVVDVIGIGLYFAKSVLFISLLYVVLLIMAVNGYSSWTKALTERGETN